MPVDGEVHPVDIGRARRLPRASPRRTANARRRHRTADLRRGRHGLVPPRRPRRCSSCWRRWRRPASARSSYAASCGRCARSRRPPTRCPSSRWPPARSRSTERVPEHLTDERTEVGQVGSALNTMLEHVEASLGARHTSEQQVRQFVADASHELRTPLTTIAGYTELARSRPDDKAAADTALAKVEEESGRMTALVEDLLLLARLDSGRPLVSEPVDLTRLLRRGRLRLPRARPRPPVAAVAARGVGRGHRRRAAAAPGRHQPAGERPQVHARRHHRHRLGPLRRLRRPRRRPRLPRRPRRPRLRALRPRRRRAYPRRQGGRRTASASPWSPRSSPPTAARWPCTRCLATRRCRWSCRRQRG